MTTKINMLAIDLVKGSFQVCAVGPGGAVIYNRARSRTQLAALLAEQPACVVAMEACATSHYWAGYMSFPREHRPQIASTNPLEWTCPGKVESTN